MFLIIKQTSKQAFKQQGECCAAAHNAHVSCPGPGPITGGERVCGWVLQGAASTGDPTRAGGKGRHTHESEEELPVLTFTRFTGAIEFVSEMRDGLNQLSHWDTPVTTVNSFEFLILSQISSVPEHQMKSCLGHGEGKKSKQLPRNQFTDFKALPGLFWWCRAATCLECNLAFSSAPSSLQSERQGSQKNRGISEMHPNDMQMAFLLWKSCTWWNKLLILVFILKDSSTFVLVEKWSHSWWYRGTKGNTPERRRVWGGLASPCEKLSSSAEPKVCFFSISRQELYGLLSHFKTSSLNFVWIWNSPSRECFCQERCQYESLYLWGRITHQETKTPPKTKNFKNLNLFPLFQPKQFMTRWIHPFTEKPRR